MFTASEFELRHKLRDAMKGLWRLTWHEDRHINPGVPDISFVVLGHDCETGWLELKATSKLPPSGRLKFTVEPSQIEWIRDHNPLIPIRFLVRVEYEWFLLDGEWAAFLGDTTYTRICDGCLARGILDDLREQLPEHLIAATKRAG